MLTEAELYEALDDIFKDVFLRDDIKLRPDLAADDVEGWDSFKQVEIIMGAEERFGISMLTREIDSLRNVGDLVQVIARHLGATTRV